jgi:glycosyltransferase involved in cell wall biosynthesis
MSRPSVLVVHNRYRERGGEDSVFEAESALLESHGHRVERLLFDNAGLPEQPSLPQALGLALGTVWSRTGRSRLRDAVARFRPDVVHFHNTLPQVSPAAYAVCHEAGAAVVQTLHNYRLVCPSGLLYRDDHACEDCVGRRMAMPAITHACYRGSRAQSATVAAMTALHRLRGTWERDVDLYIAPSRFLRDKMIEGGLVGERIAVKPNFMDDPGDGKHDGGYALFVGRLTATKGVETLLRAYRDDAGLPPLHVAGDGELAPAVQAVAVADSRICYRGRLGRAEVLTEMRGAACLVFPSVWYENFPVTLVEAMATGLPVVASDIGALGELVDDGRTGLRFRPGDSADLASKLRALTASAGPMRAMGAAARETYLVRYTADRNYEQLLACYDRALAEMNRRRGSLLGENKDSLSERIPAKP